MMLDLGELEKALLESKSFFTSIHIPRDGGKWRVNLRDGPGWIAGPPADTLTEAFDLAMRDFRRQWADKRDIYRKKWSGAKPAPVDDPLGDLLG
jgi:hypothetical protein